MTRNKWKRFRKRFNDLSFSKALDYRQYRQLTNEGGLFKFTGGIESITDGHTLWVRGDDLTIPVSLETESSVKTDCFLLHSSSGTPMQEDEVPEAFEKINWDQISTLTEGAKVFIGGHLKLQNNRLSFCSTKEDPLMVIFYNCSDNDLLHSIICSARSRNGYWNNLSPIATITGVMALIYIAASLLGRPAFRLTVICAIISVFIPILPVFPPGLLLTTLYRRFSWNARKLRAKKELLHYGLLPSSEKQSEKRYAIKAYTIEVFAWFFLFIGICINILFIFLLLFMFQIISF